jgi:glucokinase
MKNIVERLNMLQSCLLFVCLTIGSVAIAKVEQADEAEQKSEITSTADHSLFEELQQDFNSGPEVTKACLSCHTEAGKQLHKTTHWTWAFENKLTGEMLGKKNVINNFCVATASNWARCTSCHIGYGWKDASFDLTSEENIDC